MIFDRLQNAAQGAGASYNTCDVQFWNQNRQQGAVWTRRGRRAVTTDSSDQVASPVSIQGSSNKFHQGEG